MFRMIESSEASMIIGDEWGAHILVFMFTKRKNNQLQKKLIIQKTNI